MSQFIVSWQALTLDLAWGNCFSHYSKWYPGPLFPTLLFDTIVNKIGELGLIQLTFFASAIFIAIIAFTKTNLVVALSTFVVFLAFDLFRPAVTTYLSKHAGNRQEQLMV